MDRSEKERIVGELTERLRAAETLIVADYRGLSTKDLQGLRRELAQHGARLTIVKNTLTRRAAEAAGAEAVLALLEGPSALAFVESDGDPVAVAKALRETARTTRVLEVRGGLLEGRELTGDDIERLATLPPLEALHGQVLAAIVAPLNAIVGLVNAPLQGLVGLVEARIEQLGGAEGAPPDEADAAPDEPESAAAPEAAEPAAEGSADAPEAAEPAAEEPAAAPEAAEPAAEESAAAPEAEPGVEEPAAEATEAEPADEAEETQTETEEE